MSEETANSRALRLEQKRNQIREKRLNDKIYRENKRKNLQERRLNNDTSSSSIQHK